MPQTTESKIFRAHHLTEGLKLSSILGLFSDKPYRVSGTELVYRYATHQYCIIYNFGSIVFFGVYPDREKQVLSTLQQFISPRDSIQTSEEFQLDSGGKPQVEFGKVIVGKLTFEKVQIVSLVLAQSTALEFFESLADDLLEKSGTITEQLEKGGRVGLRDSELIKFIGFCLNTKQKIIGTTFLLDPPDPTWESQTLEHLYRQMVDMFELRERYRTLDSKLRLIQDTVEVLSDLSSTRRSWYLEIAIVALIAIEVILFIYDLGWGR